jgi:outer membrane protein X
MLKRVFVFVFAVAMTVASVFAQEKGDMAVGGGLSLGFGDDYTNVGIGAKFQYNVIKPLRLEGAFTYFFKKDYISQWDFSAYAHYLFPVGDKVTLYPLAGLGVLGTKVDLGDGLFGGSSLSHSDFAFAFGGGADFALTDNLSIYADLKYKIADYMNRAILSAGVIYKF